MGELLSWGDSAKVNNFKGALTLSVVFDHSEPQATNIISFWFKPDKPVDYTAGQFIEIRLPHDNADKRGNKRWFTLSSSPSEELIAITTKFAAENGSSFKETLRNLKPGVEVEISQPMGDFVLPKDPSIPLVFVAGGIGCTPMRSMIRWLLDNDEQRAIQLLYSVNTLEEVAFKDLFKSYKLDMQIIPNNPPANWEAPSGRLDAAKILQIIGNDGLENKQFYISGPEPMIEALENGLKSADISKKHLISDFFPGYTEV